MEMKLFVLKHNYKIFLLIVVFLLSGCGGSQDGGDLAITETVLNEQWKPKIRQEIVNYYNEKYMAPLANRLAIKETLAMLNIIESIKITQLSVNQKGIKKRGWFLTDKARSMYVDVAYSMDEGEIPDGISQRQLKVYIRGFDQIDRIEGV